MISKLNNLNVFTLLFIYNIYKCNIIVHNKLFEIAL